MSPYDINRKQMAQMLSKGYRRPKGYNICQVLSGGRNTTRTTIFNTINGFQPSLKSEIRSLLGAAVQTVNLPA